VNLVDPHVEAQTIGNRLIAGILQHAFAPADQDRYFSRIQMEAIEQVPDIGVTIKVEVLKRVAVAREERPDAERCRGLCGADE
jgi:hypothetical protein